MTIWKREEDKTPDQCHTALREELFQEILGSPFSHLATTPRHPTEHQLRLATRGLHKAAPLAPLHTAPAITASATSSYPPPPPPPRLCPSSQPGPGSREAAAPPEARKGLGERRDAQIWRRPLPQPEARRRRHVSSRSGRPRRPRPGSAGPAEAPPPFQATSRTALLTMVADGGGFSQADPSWASRAKDGGDDGGRER